MKVKSLGPLAAGILLCFSTLLANELSAGDAAWLLLTLAGLALFHGDLGKTLLRVVAPSLMCIFTAITPAVADSPREQLLLDFGWKFHLGDEWGIAHSLAKTGSGYGPANALFGDAS